MSPPPTDDQNRHDPDDAFLTALRRNDHRIGSAARRVSFSDRHTTSPPTWVWDRILEMAHSDPGTLKARRA